MIEVTVLIPEDKVAEFYSLVGRWLDSQPTTQDVIEEGDDDLERLDLPNKYKPLHLYLYERDQEGVTSLELTFDEINGILEDGEVLPPSAYDHRAWWANTESHAQANEWLSAGWNVASVDEERHIVVFKRANSPTPLRRQHLEYWTVFGEYLQEHNSLIQQGKLRQIGPEPNMHDAFLFGYPGNQIELTTFANRRAQETSKVPGKSIAIALTLRKPTNGHTPREITEALLDDQHAIEQQIGGRLQWPEDGSHRERRSILLIDRSLDPSKKGQWREQHAWLSDHLTRFYEVFSPRLQDIIET